MENKVIRNKKEEEKNGSRVSNSDGFRYTVLIQGVLSVEWGKWC